jgi:CheY-like chemotaxis protein
LRLLCVENNMTLRKMIDLMLAATGIDVDFVGTGGEAVEAYQTTEYDAVLMDTDAPAVPGSAMTGLKATREIRQMEDGFHLAYTPILFLSGAMDEEQVIAGREAGGDAHLMKPFTSEALIGALDRVLMAVRGSGLSGMLRAVR